MVSEHLQKLKAWISANSGKVAGSYVSIEDSNQAFALRSAIGEIMKSVNEASEIYKRSMRSPSPEDAEIAREVVSDLEHWAEIKEVLAIVKKMLAPDAQHPIKKTAIAEHIYNSIHYLERANFSPEQIERLRLVASNAARGSSDDFPDEINQKGMEKILRNAIYNLGNGSDKTLKVIREVLQNAVDATDPRTKPELASRHDWRPEIQIKMAFFKSEESKYYVDLIIDDKGTGMNWDVLSKKFFVTFESGKSTESGAAGGFGIAKALIQDAPEHGWSVDTNSIHTGRFHKNVFLGTRKSGSYTPPTTEIKKHGDGTTLSLHGLPYASEESVRELCRVYATNGRVKIFFNGEEQKPKFTLDSEDLKPLGANLDNVVDTVADSESEKEVAKNALEKSRESIAEKIEEIGQVSGTRNKYKFFLKKTSGTESGKLYVMVNGQYQFQEEKYIPRLDIILSIETTARPGDDDYPLDPGREYLRGKIKELISQLVSYISKFANDLSQDELFKDGIESLFVNEGEQPMMIDDSESTTSKKDMLLRVLGGVTGKAFAKKEDDEERQENDEERKEEPKDSGYAPATPPSDTRSPVTEKEKEEMVEQATKQITSIVGDNSAFSKETIQDMVRDVIESSEDRVEQNNKIKSLVQGLSSPGHILIQKNFVARQIVSENPQITGEMLVVWQKAIRIIIRKLTSTVSRYSSSRDRPFVPGLIYSDEALGLYMPAKGERKFDSICINPVTFAAHLLPKVFRDKLESDKDGSAFDMLDHMDSSDSSSDTPTNRVAKFVFHLAVHEICHFLYPDGYSPENFHKFITKLELVCHDEYEQIRKEVKIHMKGLRKSAQKLIGIVAKNRQPKKVAESFSSWVRCRTQKQILEGLNHTGLDPLPAVKKIPSTKDFKSFLGE